MTVHKNKFRNKNKKAEERKKASQMKKVNATKVKHKMRKYPMNKKIFTQYPNPQTTNIHFFSSER